MPYVWIILIACSALLGLGFLLQHFRYKRKARLHHQFADKVGLKLDYRNPQQFTFFGHYRDYPVRIQRLPGLAPGQKSSLSPIKFSITLNNPMRKCWVVEKPGDPSLSVQHWVVLNQSISIKHDLSEKLLISTNDMMLSARILSDNVKISVADTFRSLPAGLMYIQDEELVVLTQLGLQQEADLPLYKKMLDLLCDVKDELN